MKRKWKRQNAVTSDLLLLIGIDAPARLVATWTDEQCLAAEKWAASIHDNPARIPIRPDFLPEPWKGESAGAPTSMKLPPEQVGQLSRTALNPAAAWPFPGGK